MKSVRIVFGLGSANFIHNSYAPKRKSEIYGYATLNYKVGKDYDLNLDKAHSHIWIKNAETQKEFKSDLIDFFEITISGAYPVILIDLTAKKITVFLTKSFIDECIQYQDSLISEAVKN